MTPLTRASNQPPVCLLSWSQRCSTSMSSGICSIVWPRLSRPIWLVSRTGLNVRSTQRSQAKASSSRGPSSRRGRAVRMSTLTGMPLIVSARALPGKVVTLPPSPPPTVPHRA